MTCLPTPVLEQVKADIIAGKQLKKDLEALQRDNQRLRHQVGHRDTTIILMGSFDSLRLANARLLELNNRLLTDQLERAREDLRKAEALYRLQRRKNSKVIAGITAILTTVITLILK